MRKHRLDEQAAVVRHLHPGAAIDAPAAGDFDRFLANELGTRIAVLEETAFAAGDDRGSRSASLTPLRATRS
jgi:hypothetical protein